MIKDTFTYGQRRPYESPDVQEILIRPMSLVCASPGGVPDLDGEDDFGLFDFPGMPSLPSLPSFPGLPKLPF